MRTPVFASRLLRQLHFKSSLVAWNSAAAHSQVQDHKSAVSDAREALKIDPSFSKAYSRLGHALFSIGEYQEAVDAYEKGLELDPTVRSSSLGLARESCGSGRAFVHSAAARVARPMSERRTDRLSGFAERHNEVFALDRPLPSPRILDFRRPRRLRRLCLVPLASRCWCRRRRRSRRHSWLPRHGRWHAVGLACAFDFRANL